MLAGDASRRPPGAVEAALDFPAPEPHLAAQDVDLGTQSLFLGAGQVRCASHQERFGLFQQRWNGAQLELVVHEPSLRQGQAGPLFHDVRRQHGHPALQGVPRVAVGHGMEVALDQTRSGGHIPGGERVVQGLVDETAPRQPLAGPGVQPRDGRAVVGSRQPGSQ